MELAKIARRDEQKFKRATWVRNARRVPQQQFRPEVSKHLTAKDTERWEMLYFKIYKSQLAVIEHALESATLMLGGDKARRNCLEMVAADSPEGRC